MWQPIRIPNSRSHFCCHYIDLPEISNSQSQTFNQRYGFGFFVGQTVCVISRWDETREKQKNLTNVSSWEATIKQYLSPLFLSTSLYLLLPCSKSLLYLLLPLSHVKAQYKLADITRPQARGFVTNRDRQRPPDKETMATDINEEQKIAGLQKLGEWWTVAWDVLLQFAPHDWNHLDSC